MSDLLNDLFRSIDSKELIKDGEKVLLALSGGADSVFLFHLLLELKKNINIDFEVFHLNHGIRDSAKRDEQFVRDICETKRIKCHIFYENIPAFSQVEKVSLEEAGRIVRYRLLDHLAIEYTFDKILTAHHLDDQAETILMHIIRGTGLRGLSGIAERSDKIIRPLLHISKQQITDYLKQKKIDYVEDESNQDMFYFRNRVRKQIMPLLAKENSNILAAFDRLGFVANETDQYLLKVAETINLEISSAAIAVEFNELKDLDIVIQKYVIRNMLTQIGSSINDISYAQLDQLIRLLQETTNTTWDYKMKDCMFRRRYDKIYCLFGKTQDIDTDYRYQIGVNGTYIFSQERFAIKTYTCKKFKKNIDNSYIKMIDYDKINGILSIRNRQGGDLFHPLGMEGHKSVKKYMIDKKIDREKRDKIPLMFDDEKIVCICGVQIDDEYKITDMTSQALVIEYIPWSKTDA